jgi:hypothetical protein
MKNIIHILVCILISTSCLNAGTLGGYEIEYVSEPSRFHSKESKAFPTVLLEPLAYGKRVLSAYLTKEREIRGNFTIAEAKHGFQINYHNLHLKNTKGKWIELNEGFGEMFISKGLSRVQIDHGP